MFLNYFQRYSSGRDVFVGLTSGLDLQSVSFSMRHRLVEKNTHFVSEKINTGQCCKMASKENQMQTKMKLRATGEVEPHGEASLQFLLAM